MEKIIAAIKSVFEEFDETELRSDMLLDEVPDWDSMNSVNLQLELETTFEVDLSDIVLTGEYRISDVIKILEEQGASV